MALSDLPDDLHALICIAQEAVERHPHHDLNLGYRQAIGKAFGPYRDSGLPGSAQAHRRRARLCILTIEHVLPLWEAHAPGDVWPHRLLKMADDVLRGEVAPDVAIQEARRSWRVVDELRMQFNPEDAPMELAVCYGAVSALAAAYGEAWDDLDDDEIDYETTDSRDFDSNDTAFYASIAYAGGPIWPILARVNPDAEKRGAFWMWWLTEAVPAAWSA